MGTNNKTQAPNLEQIAEELNAKTAEFIASTDIPRGHRLDEATSSKVQGASVGTSSGGRLDSADHISMESSRKTGNKQRPPK